jgi:hypothetical protein
MVFLVENADEMAKLSLVPQSISSLEGRSASKFRRRRAAGLREAGLCGRGKSLDCCGWRTTTTNLWF